MRGWHFVGDKLRDGRPVPDDGVKLVHDGPCIPCQSGLHWSPTPFDALQYASGATLCLIEGSDDAVPHGNPLDKYSGKERTIVVRMDAEPLLRYFARQQALSVVHLWDAPQVVIDYLMGDDAARVAAWDATWDATWDAARAATWDAAWDAAWDATWDAARVAAWDAARAAAWDATWDATWDAARAAAWDATWDAAWAAARNDFNSLVYDAFKDWL